QGVARLRRAPGFAAVAIVTLALGIGANTAIFSVVEAVMLRPLPYPNASRIMALEFEAQGGGAADAFDLRQLFYLRDKLPAFSAIAGYEGMGTNELDNGKAVSWAAAERVSSGFFKVLGIRPQVGRGFKRSDGAKGAGGIMVLSHTLWQRAFGGNPGVLGQSVRYGGQAYTVVGVLPANFTFVQNSENSVDLYTAITRDDGLDGRNSEIIGVLRPGASVAEARAQAAALTPRLRAAGLVSSWFQGLSAEGYQANNAMQVQTELWFLLGIVGLLLLIACANVASLLLARTLTQAPELALRRALGAGTGRLCLQFLTEGIVLAAAGAAAGLGLAAAVLQTLAAGFVPWNLPLAGPITLDGRVLAFTAAVACGTAMAFAVMMAWQGSAKRLSIGRFRRRRRAREGMVIAEIAFSLLLLAGAGLLVRSLAALENAPLGFTPEGRTVMETQLPDAALHRFSSLWAFQDAVLRKLRAIPGVQTAAAANQLPLEGQANLPVEPVGDPRASTSVEVRAVSPGYFVTMGIPVLAGRGLKRSDSAAAPPVTLVSAEMARDLFRNRAMGEQLRIGMYRGKQYASPPVTNARAVVGVMGDVRTQNIQQQLRMTMYVPAAQLSDGNGSWFVVRGKVSAAELRRAVEAVQPGTYITGLQPYPEALAAALEPARFEAQLTLGFALLALLLTAVGLYGLLAYAVTKRTREIGVRMALGAPRGRLLWQVAGRGLLLAGIGIALGLAASIPLSKLTASLLYEIKPNDPETMVLAAVAMFVVAVIATIGPALRATHVDAARALRAE
ncbi:MAG: ADOP family duplicated permease, partial [Terriglobales bacterium]